MTTFDKLSASLMSRLTDDMKASMKARDSARLSAVRMLISAIRYVSIDKGELSDEQVIEVLTREAKKRKESVVAYRGAGREDQAKAEEYELAVISEYLPTLMSEDEVRAKANEILSGKNLPMGQAIGLVMKELKGKADGGVVSRIVKEQFVNNQ